MKHRNLLVLACILIIGLSALVSVQADAAGAVKLNKTSLVLGLGETNKLKVKNTKDKVTWYSSNPEIVTVNGGELTSVAVGGAVVTAEVNGTYLTCKVVVADFSGMSAEQEAVVSYALQHLGNPYVYGGSSLTKGADCSGFTMAVYQHFGYSLPHNAYMQIGATRSVSMNNIQPGDLIFYGSSKSSCSHVALYIGDGKVIHASTETTGIVISNYNYRKYVGVGRVLSTKTYLSTDVKKKTSAKEIAQQSESSLKKNSVTNSEKKINKSNKKKVTKTSKKNAVKKTSKKVK